jgi:GDPmannose 4,6-dehydratase
VTAVPIAFVTGVTGQDGGFLVEHLLAEGYTVHGLVREADPHLSALLERSPHVQIHVGDLTDARSVRQVIELVEPDEIYNLGGISSVALSWEDPLTTNAATGQGAIAVFDAAWQLQKRLGRTVRVVQASSAEIFGNPREVPQTELTPLRPESPYGVAKACAHQMAAAYRTRGLHISSCILYNHESPRRPETFVTRKITRAAARISQGLQDVLEVGNLDARRDWGWAPDYVDALVRAARHDVPNEYVIATGVSRSVRDFVATAFGHAGIKDWERRVHVDEHLIRPVDAAEQRGDATRAREILDWVPTMTFEQMVRAMVDTDLEHLRLEHNGAV